MIIFKCNIGCFLREKVIVEYLLMSSFILLFKHYRKFSLKILAFFVRNRILKCFITEFISFMNNNSRRIT